MIRATPYIYTNKSESYKKFLLGDFNVDYFCLEDGSFDLTDNVLNINSTKYTLLPIRTLNDFVNSLWQLDIVMLWTDEVQKRFEPKDLLETDKIKNHYWNLLHSIEKSHELL